MKDSGYAAVNESVGSLVALALFLRGLYGSVTGIGGVFFKAKTDHEKLSSWYSRYLGLKLEPWGGSILKWPDDKADDDGLTVWNLAARDSKWFSPSESPFMINYRVDDLDGLIARFATDGIKLHSGPEKHENGRFAWVIDPDGNKIELWEPKKWDDKNKA